jgi:hypothetical protein
VRVREKYVWGGYFESEEKERGEEEAGRREEFSRRRK